MCLSRTKHHRHLIYLPKYNMLNQWWGFFLELHTTIKYNIYIIYFKCKWGQNWGVTFPSPFISTILSASPLEQQCMCQSHGILQLPHSLIMTIVLLLHLHLSNGTIWSSSKSQISCINTHHQVHL